MNNETKFEVGDEIEWCGVRGFVSSIDNNDDYSVEASFPLYTCSFTKDGRLHSWHAEPSLKLISKAKKKRKVKLYAHLRERPLGIGMERNSYRELIFTDKEISGVGIARLPELDKEVEVEE